MYKIRSIAMYVPKSTKHKEIYQEYMEEFPNIHQDLHKFFIGEPKRIMQFHKICTLYDFLDDMKHNRKHAEYINESRWPFKNL
jgi:hypothetical protein